ncbi:MAG: shikimate kinase, partial [Bacteroidales bacterium]|nr:shikimate kinase [Bacteroidales bacterium]
MLIYLVGYMASGKSYTGSRLASKLGIRFIDLDHSIEEKYRISIKNFFLKYGEDQFRIIENQMLHRTFQLADAVIATGGGTACYFDNMEQMNRHGLTIYLKQDAEEVFQRLKRSKKPRPMLSASPDPELKEEILTQLRERVPYYEKA